MDKQKIVEARDKLDDDLHAGLAAYFTRMSELTREAKSKVPLVWDPEAPCAFAIVAFNHPESEDIIGENPHPNAVKIAISAVAAVLTPGVESSQDTGNGLQGIIGSKDVLPFGVQAVAATLLMSAMQEGVIAGVMRQAQEMILERPDKELMS